MTLRNLAIIAALGAALFDFFGVNSIVSASSAEATFAMGQTDEGLEWG